jgi:hypothetical protein
VAESSLVRLFEGAERRQTTRYWRLGSNRFTNWMMRFSAEHVVAGSLIQSVVTVLPFFVILSLITTGNDELLVGTLSAVGVLALLCWSIPYNRWRRGRFVETTNDPGKSST